MHNRKQILKVVDKFAETQDEFKTMQNIYNDKLIAELKKEVKSELGDDSAGNFGANYVALLQRYMPIGLPIHGSAEP